jgi:hypothetical protein
MRAKENLIAAWAFVIGVALAILTGLFSDYLIGTATNVVYVLLVLLGIVVGYLIVEDKESVITFLLASLSLVIVSGLGNNSLLFISNLSPILGYLAKILASLLVMFIPATIIVALKAVFSVTNI